MMDHYLEIQVEEMRRLYERSKSVGTIARVLTLGLWGNQYAIESRRKAYVDAQTHLKKFESLMERSANVELSPRLEGARRLDTSRMGVEHSTVGGYGPDWDLLSAATLARDNHECQECDGYCRGPLQAHHRIPLSRGGANSLDNLITLCQYHHSLKHEHMRGKV